MNAKILLMCLVLVIAAAAGVYLQFFTAPPTPPSLTEAPPSKVEVLTWEQLLESLADKAALEVRQHGIRFFQDGDPDKAFLLFKQASKKGDGWSAMVIGEMYDPATFAAENFDSKKSAFSKPNSRKALQWYDLAIKDGEGQAESRRKQLIAYLQTEADGGDTKAQRLLQRLQ